MSKVYLVTGGTGFIGRSLVRALVHRGDTVRCLDDDSRGHRDWLTDVAYDVEFIHGDVRDLSLVSRAVEGVDAVCHLAYVNGTDAFYRIPATILEIAVKGISNVIDACIEAGVGELSVASSSEVYQTPSVFPTTETVPLSIPDPLNPRYSYAGGKIISELIALNYGREEFDRVTVFRPHNIYGPQMGDAHVVPQLIRRIGFLTEHCAHPPYMLDIQGTGEETRAFCYISDAVDGILRIMDKGEHLGIYNVGREEEIAIASLAKMIGWQFGHDIEIVPGQIQDGSPLRRCPDISKLKALGYVPKVPIGQGLGICVQHAREAQRDFHNSDVLRVPAGSAGSI